MCILVRNRRDTLLLRSGGRDRRDSATNQGMPTATRNCRRQERLLSRTFRERMALPTPWFQTSGLQTVRELISVILGHPDCGNRLWIHGPTKHGLSQPCFSLLPVDLPLDLTLTPHHGGSRQLAPLLPAPPGSSHIQKVIQNRSKT